jgi:hypothetical protein
VTLHQTVKESGKRALRTRVETDLLSSVQLA